MIATDEEDEGLRRMEERRSREIRWRVAVVGVVIVDVVVVFGDGGGGGVRVIRVKC